MKLISKFTLFAAVVAPATAQLSSQEPIPVATQPRCGPWNGDLACPDRIDALGNPTVPQFCSKWGWCDTTDDFKLSQELGTYLSREHPCQASSDCPGSLVCDSVEPFCSYTGVDAANFLATYQLRYGETAPPSRAPGQIVVTSAPTIGDNSGGGNGDESVVQPGNDGVGSDIDSASTVESSGVVTSVASGVFATVALLATSLF